MAKKKYSGFTLIEILIVIAIIALLSLLLYLNQIRQINRGSDARRKSDLKTIQNAMESYYSDFNCYPTHDQVYPGGQCNQAGALDPYISIAPCDPSRHTPYVIDSDPVCPQSYVAYTNLSSLTDPAINSIGCTSGCGPANSYNYGVSSPNTNPVAGGAYPTPTPVYEYHCSALFNCSQFPASMTCNPHWDDDPNCGNACGDPANICTPH